MSMLTLQVLGLLLLFGLIGAFLGWLIRPFFCKPSATVGRSNLSGSAGGSANAKMGTTDASVKTAVNTASAKGGVAKDKTSKSDQSKTGNNGKAALAAAGVAAVAATAAAVDSGNNSDEASIAKANAKAEADKLAAEEKQIANDKAAKQAKEQHLALEKSKADKAAKTAAIEADKKKLAAEADAVRKAEAERLSAEKDKAEQAAKDAAKADADKLAAEKAKTDQATKDAAAKAEADRLATEKAKADQVAKDTAAKAESDRLAAEKAKADQAAKDAAAKAEADKIAADKAKSDQAAKDAAAKADADRLAAEKAKADQAAKDAAAKAEADRLAADQAAKAAGLAAVAASAAAISTSSGGDSESETEIDYASVTDDMRPERLAAPRGGTADDLKRISGIGPVIEGTLNEEGVYHFQQIADFTPDNVKWVDKNVSIPGRVHRDDWIGQAQSLVDNREYDGYAKGIAGTEDSSLPVVTEDMRPTRLAAPTGGNADDLKRINGIGPVIEKTLNSEGIYHFKQIADFTPDNVNWVDSHISFPGRITREEWIRQAKGLAAGEDNASETVVITEDMRPTRRSVEAGQKADDLKVINGIGPVIEKSLNEEGVHFYQQIADFDEDNTKWVDNHMAFPGRIHREDWIGQAKILVGQKGANVEKPVQTAITVTDDMRPTRQKLNAGDKADDLKVINGIGPVIEKSLNEEGIYFYQQIADFNEENTKWVDNHMAFPGRIHREDWIAQAKVLVGQKGSSNTEAASKPATSAVGSALGSSGAVPESMKPTLLSAPEGGKPDDLKRIKGIGKVLEKNLHEMGIYHYEQLAELTADNISWLTDYVSFPDGRIDDEDWTGQAKKLAEGKQTEYSQRFDKGDTPYK